MNPSCASCKKTVDPVEKLNCLDKIWHKGCFNCETCNVTLNMKTYRGYNKLPYCNTHYPTTKFTAVSDTPENKRLAQTTKNQSSVVYNKNFDQESGKFTAVADDPETLRIKRSQEQASGIAYRSAPGDRPAKATRPPRQTTAPLPPPPQGATSAPRSTPTHKAVYDYAAADEDEVSCSEGDEIIVTEVIGDGWVTGTVKRTGEWGMIPSNYLEKL